MNKELKKKILKMRKQKIYCDECGKEIYRPYILGAGIYCYKHYIERSKNRISPNQLRLKILKEI